LAFDENIWYNITKLSSGVDVIKDCVLEERKCNECGVCNLCDLDESKNCDNCCKCLGDSDYTGIEIDDILTSIEEIKDGAKKVDGETERK
jgi:hypothetical protein